MWTAGDRLPRRAHDDDWPSPAGTPPEHARRGPGGPYYEAGPTDGDPVVLLLHDFLHDIHSYEGVIPRLADRHEHRFMVEHVLELLATG